MELNREQIIKAMECCYDNNLSCIDCPFQATDKYFECSNLTNSALALIKELTEEVESLKQCMEHEHASFMETFGEYGEKCERLTEEVDSWKAIAEGYQKQFEDCAEDRAKLTEENERLRNKVTATIILTDKDAERIKTERLEKIELDVNAIQADTVRKMQERLISEFRKDDRMNYYIRMTLDQIAKEMLEGENNG